MALIFLENWHNCRMPKKLRVTLAILVICLCAGLFQVLRPPPEPVYQGKRLSEWLGDYNRFDGDNPFYAVRRTMLWTDEDEERQPVSAAIRAMGTNSLPFLLSHIHAYSPMEQKVISFLSEKHLFRIPSNDDDPLTGASILALRALGSTAAPALADLRKREEKSPQSREILCAMEVIGSRAIPTLQSLCESSNLIVSTDASQALATISRGDNRPMVSVVFETNGPTLRVLRCLPDSPFPRAGRARPRYYSEPPPFHNQPPLRTPNGSRALPSAAV
jgi:hypothetical protein